MPIGDLADKAKERSALTEKTTAGSTTKLRTRLVMESVEILNMANRLNGAALSVRLQRSFFIVMAACLLIPAAFAQLNSNTVTITLNATLAESISVSATPSTVTFTLVAGGTSTGNVPVAITTTWVLASSRANVVLDGYFATATAALSGSASPVVNIPSSEVLGLMSTGTPTVFTAFTANTALGPTGAGLLLFTQALSATNRNATRTDNLSLEINLSGQPQLPAASNYTGSLFLQAQAL